MNAHRLHSGFSIVEVLVALVVLAVGMLGMAGLYVTTLRSSGSAISRVQAVNLGADMADRIRANRFARTAYRTTQAGATQGCVATFNCTQEQMASNDKFVWQQQISALLPGAAPLGTITYTPAAAATPEAGATPATAATPDSYTITVAWQEAEGGGNIDGNLSYVLTLQVDP